MSPCACSARCGSSLSPPSLLGLSGRRGSSSAFDPDRDARAFHAAQQEAFADHWEFTPREFDEWRDFHLVKEKFDASLWGVVRAGDEIAAGAICVADRYGGGWVAVLFTRRQWRGRGAAARSCRTRSSGSGNAVSGASV